MALAARGARNLDSGEEKIGDAAEAALFRRQAKAVYVKASLVAAALTALAFLPA